MVKQQRVAVLIRSCRWSSVFNKLISLALFLLFTLTFPAKAVVNVDKTRVIFNSGSSVASLSLANSEKEPMIIQVWTDNGDPTVSPDKARTPVVIQPSVFKMKQGEVRSVRLFLSPNSKLPRDRESIFWLNIYQIPPNTQMRDMGKQQVILPLKIRMKVLVRPDGIEQLKEKDARKMSIGIFQGAEGKKIKFLNPTPWHLSLTSLKSGDIKLSNIVINPFSTQMFNVPEGQLPSERVEYDVINDDGFNWLFERDINILTN